MTAEEVGKAAQRQVPEGRWSSERSKTPQSGSNGSSSSGGSPGGGEPESSLPEWALTNKVTDPQAFFDGICSGTMGANVAECQPDTAPAGAPAAAAPAGAAPALAPVITPAQAGAMAVARLQLPVNVPGIGPDPDQNQWRMAAVGYPLWLWSDGPSQVGPVGQNVAGLSVSLRARVAETVFRMGDGNTVRCAGLGTPYRASVKPGTKSPDCGYRYEKASLPKGTYTVTVVTSWAVTWTANGVSGVITVPREGSAELPVGELQSLVR